MTGGVHTPNHRWVVCAALAQAELAVSQPQVCRPRRPMAGRGHRHRPQRALRREEHDGLLAGGRPRAPHRRAAAPAIRTLRASSRKPFDGALVRASRRRSRDRSVAPTGSLPAPGRHGPLLLPSYRTLALLDGNGRFAAMTRQIERTARSQIGDLLAFLHEPEFARALPPDAPLPADYEKVFRYQGLARIRRGAVSGTILAGNTTLFSFRRGAAALEAVRLASAFFGKGQVAGDELVFRDGGFELRQTLDGPYLPAALTGSDRRRRTCEDGPQRDARRRQQGAPRAQQRPGPRIRGPHHRDGGEVHPRVLCGQGTSEVPVAIELAFRRGGTLQGVEPVAGVSKTYLLSTGTGRYVAGGDTIEFGSRPRRTHVHPGARRAAQVGQPQRVLHGPHAVPSDVAHHLTSIRQSACSLQPSEAYRPAARKRGRSRFPSRHSGVSPP